MKITIDLPKKHVEFIVELHSFVDDGNPAKDMFFGMDDNAPTWSDGELLHMLCGKIANASKGKK